MEKPSWVRVENALFIFVLIILSCLFVLADYISPIDSCLEDTICPEGTELPNCPPCWSEPCVVNKELCDKVGAYWIEELRTCNFNILTISKEYCEKAGGEWIKGGCNFDKICKKLDILN